MDIPLLGVSTLKCLAFNSVITPHLICSMLDAKKGQLYCGFFRYNVNELERVAEDTIVNIDYLCSNINEATVFIGDGLNLYKSTFVDKINGLALFAPEHLCYPRASSCAILGVDSFKKAKRDEVNSLVPSYIRQPDAALLDDKR